MRANPNRPDKGLKIVDSEFARYLVFLWERQSGSAEQSLCKHFKTKPNIKNEIDALRRRLQKPGIKTPTLRSSEEELRRLEEIRKKQLLFISIIEHIKSSAENFDKDGAYIKDFYADRQVRLTNYPSIFIRFMEACTTLHDDKSLHDFLRLRERCYADGQTEAVKSAINANFVKIGELCVSYRNNGFERCGDDKLKELLLLQNQDSAVAELFETDLENYIKEAGRNYSGFHDTLSRLAKKYGFNGRKGLAELYGKADINPKTHSLHRDIKNEPKRDDVFTLILIMKLNLADAEALLKAAGFQLNDCCREAIIRTMIITRQWNLELYRRLSNKYSELFCQNYNRANAKAKKELPPNEAFLEYLYQQLSKFRKKDSGRLKQLPPEKRKTASKTQKYPYGNSKWLKRLYYSVFDADGLRIFLEHVRFPEPDSKHDPKAKKIQLELIADFLKLKGKCRRKLFSLCPGI